jgi:hypothetical protein
MKKPRIEDFDPKMVHDLKSSMDHLPAIESPRSRQITSVAPPPERPANAEVTTPDVRPYGRTGQRATTRYPFEFFQDQVETLRRLSLEEKSRGEKGSMSQMARDALDMYIAKRLQPDG